MEPIKAREERERGSFSSFRKNTRMIAVRSSIGQNERAADSRVETHECQ